MKIVLINNLFKPFDRGGAEKIVAESIEDLKHKGHEIFLITTKPKRADKPDNPEIKTYYLNSSYYHLRRLPSCFRLLWHLHNLFDTKKYRKLQNILKSIKPDLVITHNLMGIGFKTPAAIRELGIRHEHVLHDIQLLHPSGLMMLGKEKVVDRWPAKMYQSLTRRLFASPDKIHSPSKWLLDEHKKRGFFPESSFIVGPLTATIEQSSLPPVLLSIPAKKFLFVGQIETHKGILWLIKAFRQLADKDLSLTVIGDGSQLNEAKKITKNDPRISFLGRKNYKQIKEAMRHTDYLIVPSLCYENRPTIIEEAHRQSCPVIAANLGGIPEIIMTGDELFKAGDDKSLIKVINDVKAVKK